MAYAILITISMVNRTNVSHPEKISDLDIIYLSISMFFYEIKDSSNKIIFSLKTIPTSICLLITDHLPT